MPAFLAPASRPDLKAKSLLPFQRSPHRLPRLAGLAAAATDDLAADLVGALEVGSDQGRPYLVIEFVPGQDLEELLKRGDLPANVVRKDGDVYIQGIPMVDQGQKGYCVVATASRVFQYYDINVDQHEMAQIANSSAEGWPHSRFFPNA